MFHFNCCFQDLDSETRLNVIAHLILSKSWKQPEEAEELALQLPEMNQSTEVEDGEDDEDIDAVQLEAQCNLPRNNRIRRLVVVDRAAARAERKEQEGADVTAVKLHYLVFLIYSLPLNPLPLNPLSLS